jgi:hypothetical protein
MSQNGLTSCPVPLPPIRFRPIRWRDVQSRSLLQSGQWADDSRRKGEIYIDQSKPTPLQSGQWVDISRRKDDAH